MPTLFLLLALQNFDGKDRQLAEGAIVGLASPSYNSRISASASLREIVDRNGYPAALFLARYKTNDPEVAERCSQLYRQYFERVKPTSYKLMPIDFTPFLIVGWSADDFIKVGDREKPMYTNHRTALRNKAYQLIGFGVPEHVVISILDGVAKIEQDWYKKTLNIEE